MVLCCAYRKKENAYTCPIKKAFVFLFPSKAFVFLAETRTTHPVLVFLLFNTAVYTHVCNRLKTHQKILLPDDPEKVPRWLYLDLEFVSSGSKVSPRGRRRTAAALA